MCFELKFSHIDNQRRFTAFDPIANTKTTLSLHDFKSLPLSVVSCGKLLIPRIEITLFLKALFHFFNNRLTGRLIQLQRTWEIDKLQLQSGWASSGPIKASRSDIYMDVECKGALW